MTQLGNGRFANLRIAPGGFSPDGLDNNGSLFPDFREFSQVARFRLQQGFQTQKPAVHQHVGLFLRDAGNGGDGFDRLGHFLLKPQRREVLRLDVHLPSGQLGGEAGVLSALAYRQGKLVFTDEDFNAATGFVDFKSLQFGGRERVGDEISHVRVPLDDVPLLVVEFADDVFDSLPAQADTRAHWIHLFVARPYRQLGAKTGLARDPFDFNRAVVDFRDFQPEQFHHELGVGARENDLRPVRRLLDRLDVAADAFTDLVFLRRHALAIGEQGLEFAQVNRDIRTVE